LAAALNGRVAFYSWIRAQAHLVVAEENVGLAESLLVEMKVAFDVGTASKADILGVEAQIAAANLLMERARSAAQVAEERLRVTLHKLPPGQPIRIGEDPRRDAPAMAGEGDLDGLRSEALTKRLEVRALDETKWAFTEKAEAARGNAWPRLELFANGVYANPNQRFFPQEDEFKFTWDAGAVLSWSPNAAVAASAQAAEADANASQTQMQKSALRDAIRIEVTQAYQAFREARLGIETSELQRKAAAEAFKVRQQLFGRGRATGYELTQDAHELTRARVNVVNARIAVFISRAQLVHATGRDVEELGELERPTKR
jgi:outer membrane protein TolC